ncbi:MAG: UDP-N-acetylmuramate--L-alanine ligase, partial [Candidatus Saganbacteria bacterium]|nr:UDP-N-acetylmuramate--L-alanine ligase [Candidatus Saganbacteria bacterium]
MAKPKMERVKNVHLLGIGGVGVSAIAKILFQMGFQVSGSDVKESSNTMRLKDLGVKVFIDHDPSQVRFADMVVYSSAVAANNVEMQEARARDIPIYQRAEVLAWIMDQFPKRIAVAGTHGKTTTSSMLAHIFSDLGYDPTFLIGAQMDHNEGNAKLGKGQMVVAEADESDKSFLCLNPNIEVITNIETDHMENFGTLDKILQVFQEFAGKLGRGDRLVLCGDQENNQWLMKKLSKEIELITYGLNPGNIWQAQKMKFFEISSSFEVYKEGVLKGEMFLSIPGWQNVLNSLAAITVSDLFGCDLNLVFGSLRTFKGAERRFQLIGEINDVLVFDDYAHHPTEIRATIDAAKKGWPNRRVICVFQPHRFTRTFFLRKEFGPAFDLADDVIITDIYSAGEMPIQDITG